MEVKGGFWQNFKGALGIGLGGGLGAGFGWKVGQWLGELFIRLSKWIALLLVGVAASLYQQYGRSDEDKAAQKAKQAQMEAAQPPNVRKQWAEYDRRRAAEKAAAEKAKVTE